jgi:predicted DNA-binding transcriptional regulator AlpA
MSSKSSRRQAARAERVYTLRQFAALNSIALMTLLRLIDRGEGPPVIQLSPHRLGIRESDGAAWQSARVQAPSGRDRKAERAPGVG